MVYFMENPMNKWMIWVVKTSIFGNNQKSYFTNHQMLKEACKPWKSKEGKEKPSQGGVPDYMIYIYISLYTHLAVLDPSKKKSLNGLFSLLSMESPRV